MSFENFKRGVGSYVTCMAAVGVEVRTLDSTNLGFPTVLLGERYLPGVNYTDDEYQALRKACASKSYFPLASVYQSQPAAVDAKAQHMTQYLPALATCLGAHGAKLPSHVTYDELQQTISEVFDDSGVSCDLETGFVEDQVFPDDFWER